MYYGLNYGPPAQIHILQLQPTNGDQIFKEVNGWKWGTGREALIQDN